MDIFAYSSDRSRHGDPNTARLPGSPIWPRYDNTTDLNIAFDEPVRNETGLRMGFQYDCAAGGWLDEHAELDSRRVARSGDPAAAGRP